MDRDGVCILHTAASCTGKTDADSDHISMNSDFLGDQLKIKTFISNRTESNREGQRHASDSD